LALEGRNAFLNALDDGALEYEVLKFQPLGTVADGVLPDKTATLRLLALINLVLRCTRALSVMNLAIGIGIALPAKIGQGKKPV